MMAGPTKPSRLGHLVPGYEVLPDDVTILDEA